LVKKQETKYILPKNPVNAENKIFEAIGRKVLETKVNIEEAFMKVLDIK
jgi:hypothetical protein